MIRSAKALAISAALMFVGGSITASAANGGGAGVGVGQSGGANQCEVVQLKTGGTGIFDVTRAVQSSGKCVCYVKLAPNPTQSVATQLAALLQSRDCSNAPPAVQQQGGGIGSGGLVAGGAAAAAAGLAAAAGGNDSP